MERKYIFEAGLDVFTSFKTIVPVENLMELSKFDKHLYHIYGILSYDRIYFRKEKTKIISNGIQVTLFTVKDGNEVNYNLPLWEILPGVDYRKVKLTLTFPYTFITVKIEDEDFLSSHSQVVNPEIEVHAQDLFSLFAETLVHKQEFEVLYIGQAYGKNGSRTAFDRLASHSTLQKILTDYQTKNPNKHIYILLLEFTPNLSMSFDGLTKRYTKSEEESNQHMEEVLCDLPRGEQIINITEAALIYYFKPEYNVTFIENFPDVHHKGYKQYFDLDYNSLTVELDMEFDHAPIIQLYSKTNRINSSFDFIRYKLYNDNERLSMYEIFEKKDRGLASKE